MARSKYRSPTSRPTARLTDPAEFSPWDSQARLLLWLATCVSVFSFLFYFQRGEVLLYGDAVAHLNIARRVFDSKTPGLLQLGTVWLPLPHLLMIPFLLSDKMWRLGVGGSIPSLVAYVLSVVGIFRLVRGSLASRNETATSLAAWIAAIVFAANPSLIYMQTTAMGEALYLALFVWCLVYFSEFVGGETKALTKCGLCLAAACLTRYDAWFVAALLAGIVAAFSAFPDFAQRYKIPPVSRAAAAKFVLIAAVAPMLWLAYNDIVYRNPLEFANGPYSARAIEQRTENPNHPGHPGSGSLLVSGLYFLKTAEYNVAANQWLQRAWILFLFAGIVATVWRRSKLISDASQWPLLFLLIPIPFYALSVAYGGVPIFIPAWWPFTHYNVRYGLQLLPAFAVAFGLLVYVIVKSDHWGGKLRTAFLLALAALFAGSYGSVWYAGPICLTEAQVNMRTRNLFEHQLASLLQKLPTDCTLLMYLGDHVGALQQGGIPLSHVINEGNHRVRKRPSDPDGLWERALANPAQYADYVVAFEGDPVWQAMQGQHLRELIDLHVTGQSRAILYRAR